jgi:hypothetical protein
VRSLAAKATLLDISDFLTSNDVTDKPDNKIETINGAEVFRKLFGRFAPTWTEFSKTEHCKFLVDWLIKENSDHLRPLIDFLAQRFEP